jgi:ABC-2 type transport system permease protein
MNLWRLEWLRLTRRPRALALGAIFVVFGLGEPLATKYQNDLLGHVGRGVRVYLPPPAPSDAISSYISNASVIGLIVVVALAASVFSFDAHQGLAIFLRTRVTSMWRLLLPRFTVSAAAAAIAYLLGTLAAWYETDLLIGPLPAGWMLAGVACGALYLVFAVALAALAASLVRGTVAAVAVALAVLLVLPIAGTWHVIDNWLPSALVNDPVTLLTGPHDLAHYLPAVGVALAASTAALVFAAARLQAREI